MSTMMDTDNAPSSIAYANYFTTWTPVDGMTPVATNPSRKRSRDETAFEAAEAENSYFPLKPPEPILEEPVYGEGMVLINPATGRALPAETQTGTWYEEKIDEEAVIKQAEAEARPRLPVSRKSMRVSQSSIRTAFDLPSLSAPASPSKSAPLMEIDEATIALGISWTKMNNEDPDLQAAARGWARYLEVHYSSHIHGAEILLKNTNLNAYLVGCQEGFFLFTEDLLRGQLVGRTWEMTLNRLRSQPVQYEGTEVLQAERTPGPESEATRKVTINSWSDWNKINSRLSNGIVSNEQTVALGMDLD